MAGRYKSIRRTPRFIADYAEIRDHLREKSPVAYRALPHSMTTILNVIERHPRAWSVKRKALVGTGYEFHLAITDIAYRRIHVRYHVDEDDISHLLTVWIDGQDEPNYVIDIETQ